MSLRKTFFKKEKYKLIATIVVVSFFLFFWINGPLFMSDTTSVTSVARTEYAVPMLVTGEDVTDQEGFGTIRSDRSDEYGYGLVTQPEYPAFGLLASTEKNPQLSFAHAEQMLENAHAILGEEYNLKIQPAPDLYYIEVQEPESMIYVESTGLVKHIHGYGGVINIGILIKPNGTIRSIHHISSNETASYLKDIENKGYYEQYKTLDLNISNDIDAISGATLTTKAIAQIATYIVGIATPEPVSNYAGLMDISLFDVRAVLSLSWIVHIAVIALLFVYGYQKKIKKGKRQVIVISVLSAAYIGFFMNNSFTYISFIHPFMGTSVSSLVGIYALFTLLGAIWGKNTYCKYVCPFGNVQRLLIQATPKVKRKKLPFSNKWTKRIRGIITLSLITGIFLGLRGWSNFELFPDLFGMDYTSAGFLASLLKRRQVNILHPV